MNCKLIRFWAFVLTATFLATSERRGGFTAQEVEFSEIAERWKEWEDKSRDCTCVEWHFFRIRDGAPEGTPHHGASFKTERFGECAIETMESRDGLVRKRLLNKQYTAAIEQNSDRWILTEVDFPGTEAYESIADRLLRNPFGAIFYILPMAIFSEENLDSIELSGSNPRTALVKFRIPAGSLPALSPQVELDVQMEVDESIDWLPRKFQMSYQGGQRETLTGTWVRNNGVLYCEDVKLGIPQPSGPMHTFDQYTYNMTANSGESRKNTYLSYYGLPEPKGAEKTWSVRSRILFVLVAIGACMVVWRVLRSRKSNQSP